MAYQPKSYRKFLAGTVTAAVVASAVAPAASAAFTDVAANDTHAVNVNKAVSMGLINGYPDGTFGTYQDITRGQVAKIIARYLGNVDTTGTQQFTDVANSPDTELKAAALKVRAAGVFTGSDGALNAGKNITRQEMASVVARLFELTDIEGVDSKVTDNDKAWEVHRANINLLSEYGITTEASFNPLANVKRGQFASFIVRAIELAQEVKIEKVTALDTSGRFVEVTFSKPVVGLDATDITIQDSDTLARKGVKDVKLSSNGKVATVELFTQEDVTYVLAPLRDYTVKVSVNGETLSYTFNRPAYTKSVISDIDTDKRTFTVLYDHDSDSDTARVNVKVDVPADTEFDFYNALGREARVWFDQDNDLVSIAYEEQELVETSVKVTKAITATVDGEVQLEADGKKYDLASDFKFINDGDSSATFGGKDKEYDYAKVVFNSSGDVKTIVAYTLVDSILVSKVDEDYIFGYDNEDLDLEDYVIVKDGKQISVSDIKKDDLVFFNEDAEEDGFAIVYNNTVSGEIENVFQGSFDIDGKNYDYSGEYLKNGKTVESFNKDAAERLQAGGNVVVYLDYKGDVVFVKGQEGVVTDKYAAGYQTDALLPYFDAKDAGYIEAELATKDGEKLYDFKVSSLDEIVIQSSGEELEIEVGDNLPSEFRFDSDSITDWEIEEFKLVKVADDLDAEGNALLEADADEDDADEFYIVAINDAKEELGAVAHLDNYSKDVFGVFVDNGAVKGLKFYDDSAVVTNTSKKIESKDKYVEGYQLTDETVVLDIDAARAEYADAKDVKFTTWGELKERGVDIDQDDADAYINEDGIITHLAVYGLEAADTVEKKALITRVDVNTDKKIVRIEALVDGERKVLSANKLGNDKVGGDINDIVAGLVVELKVNTSNDEVTEISIDDADSIAGVVVDVKVGERKVEIRLDNGETITKELANGGQVYKATDRRAEDFSVKNLRDIAKGDKVIFALAADNSPFAEAIVIASDAVLEANDLEDTTGPTFTSTPSFADTNTADNIVAGNVGFSKATNEADVVRYVVKVADAEGVKYSTTVTPDGSSTYSIAVPNTNLAASTDTVTVSVTAVDASGNETVRSAVAADAVTPAP